MVSRISGGRRVLGLGGVLALVGLVSTLAMCRDRPRIVNTELAAAATPASAPLTTTAALRSEARAPTGAATRAPLPTTQATPHAPEPTRTASAEPGRWIETPKSDNPGEVCGLGHATPGSAEAVALAQTAAARDAQAAARLFALMARSPDPATRAAALLGTDQRAALAKEALHTRDPIVYALAQQACGRAGPRPDACEPLSPHRMAALDPLNVVPWLWVAEEAARAGNTQGVAEATYRASLARESRLREYAFTQLALASIPPDWPSWEAVFASAFVLQVHAELRLPSYLPLVAYCSAENTRDPNVRQTCDRLARVLVDAGDTLVDHGIGRRIGERAGWPAERLELLQAHQAAYRTMMALDGDTLAAGAGHGSCRQLMRNVQLAWAHSRDGELPFARARLAESGLSDAEVLRQFRQRPAGASPR